MKKSFLIITALLICLTATAQLKQWNYPPTPKIPVYDTIWGKVIKDDYRWMENVESPTFTEWLKAQNALTVDLMSKIPNQDKIARALRDYFTQMGDFYTNFSGNDSKAVYRKAKPEENVTKLYYRDKRENKEKLLLDPEKYMDGKLFSISDLLMSEDGKYAAFNISELGQENGKVRIIDLTTSKLLPEELPGRIPSFTKIKGQQYISYLALDNENVHKNSYRGGTLKLHLVNTDISNDRTVVAAKDHPELNYNDQLELLSQTSWDDPERCSFRFMTLVCLPSFSIKTKPKATRWW